MLWKLFLLSLSGTAVSCLERPKLHQHPKAMPKFAQQTPFPLHTDYFHCLKRIFLLLWYFSSGFVNSFFFYLSIQSSTIFFSVRLWIFLEYFIHFQQIMPSNYLAPSSVSADFQMFYPNFYILFTFFSSFLFLPITVEFRYH